MSEVLFKLLDEKVNELLAEHAQQSGVKLTVRALADRAGLSVSTVKLEEYRPIRKRLLDAKPSRVRAATNEDAVEWRRKYYQLRSEKAVEVQSLRQELDAKSELTQRLIAELQVSARRLAQQAEGRTPAPSS